MNGLVVRNIRHADATVVAVLARLGVATVHEAQGRSGLMQPYMRPLWRGARIAGSAVTALCHPGDNWMIHVAVEVLKPGDVLIVACSSESTDGAFGELLATSLKARGAKGVVLDMGCRDAHEIAEMQFPLWSRAISAKGTVKATIGSVNVPVVCAGVQVNPGDVVVADDDGVVMVARANAQMVAQAGEEREKKEAAARARLEKGELGLDIYGMRRALEEKGLKYVDGPLDCDVHAKLRTLLGDYPVTRAMKSAEVRSADLAFDFAQVKVPNTAFKLVVRDLEFDVAELAIVTFLLARAHGKPLCLLPAVVTARFQHPFLVYNAERGPLAPGDLAGRRVGLRSYSVTTAAWVRAVLADDYGVAPERVKWISFEEPHVAEYRDPPNVERAPPGKDMISMLLEGTLDAGIVGERPSDPRLTPVIPDPAAAARAWHQRTGALQVNHMLVIKDALAKGRPRAAQEIVRLFADSKHAAGLPAPDTLDMNPVGREANRRNLEVAIDCVYRQGMIPRRFEPEDLFA